MKLNFQRQAGATLIEIIMVVALIAMITIGALVFYNTAQDGTNVEEAVSGLTALTAVVRNQFATQGNYNGITEDVVMKFGGIPENLLVRNSSGAPTTLKHAWNSGAGAVDISAATTTATDDSFEITLNNVPAKLCADVMSKTYRHFLKAEVGSTAVTSVATITNACGTTGEKSLTFTAR